ncbi:MAG: glutamine-hydrolyzing carbamoyl-phosphate synthase small subunit [Acidobacteria bacterium]|nr:glutamine-hydrolyzing carbamoyl-phosphate synthase small subunit [Acidobacteriota bacterium]
MTEAILALEDGRVFRGRAFGAPGERCGEVVFNTAMSGYQEILTDPSYAGQIVVMTYPLIGNYGINAEDVEARGVFLEGFVVREVSPSVSNWRSAGSIGDYLAENGVVGISEIDTRALVRHIRDKGAMRACISTETLDEAEAVRRATSIPEMAGRELASSVTCDEQYAWGGDVTERPFGAPSPAVADAPARRLRIVTLDFGVKYNSLRYLNALGCDVTVLPSTATAEQVLSIEPDGLFISNGPGDPATLDGPIRQIREIVDAGIPTFGICLGHQLLGHALGGKTFKLPFGHHGGNHPVKDLRTGRVEITAQNHGFAVEAESLPDDVEITHLNLNDNTVEGLRHRSKPVFAVQYHPEAGPGPHDAEHLFVEFVSMIRGRQEMAAV